MDFCHKSIFILVNKRIRNVGILDDVNERKEKENENVFSFMEWFKICLWQRQILNFFLFIESWLLD